ncbi:MAG TPA: hypothetical protein VIM35_06285 [Gallionella sp.]
MSSPREILQALTNAAAAVEAEIPQSNCQSNELRAAIDELRVALDMAYQELNQSHQLVVFVDKGKVRAYTDVDINMSCMIVIWGINPNDSNDPDLAEITWTRSQTNSGKVSTDHQPCEVDPVLVNDVVRTFDAIRDKALAKLKAK